VQAVGGLVQQVLALAGAAHAEPGLGPLQASLDRVQRVAGEGALRGSGHGRRTADEDERRGRGDEATLTATPLAGRQHQAGGLGLERRLRLEHQSAAEVTGELGPGGGVRLVAQGRHQAQQRGDLLAPLGAVVRAAVDGVCELLGASSRLEQGGHRGVPVLGSCRWPWWPVTTSNDLSERKVTGRDEAHP
jgi:hypothetical protein